MVHGAKIRREDRFLIKNTAGSVLSPYLRTQEASQMHGGIILLDLFPCLCVPQGGGVLSRLGSCSVRNENPVARENYVGVIYVVQLAKGPDAGAVSLRNHREAVTSLDLIWKARALETAGDLRKLVLIHLIGLIVPGCGILYGGVRFYIRFHSVFSLLCLILCFIRCSRVKSCFFRGKSHQEIAKLRFGHVISPSDNTISWQRWFFK